MPDHRAESWVPARVAHDRVHEGLLTLLVSLDRARRPEGDVAHERHKVGPVIHVPAVQPRERDPGAIAKVRVRRPRRRVGPRVEGGVVRHTGGEQLLGVGEVAVDRQPGDVGLLRDGVASALCTEYRNSGQRNDYGGNSY